MVVENKEEIRKGVDSLENDLRSMEDEKREKMIWATVSGKDG